MQLRTDGVHCRESGGTGPINLKVVPVTGAVFADHHGPINVRLSFPTPIIGMKWACLKYRSRKGETGKLLRIRLLIVTEPKESSTGARRTETCVAPRHADASRDALLAICSFCSLCCTQPVFIFILFPPYYSVLSTI